MKNNIYSSNIMDYMVQFVVAMGHYFG